MYYQQQILFRLMPRRFHHKSLKPINFLALFLFLHWGATAGPPKIFLICDVWVVKALSQGPFGRVKGDSPEVW